MDRDAVGENIEQSDAVLALSLQMDEANTKAAILQSNSGISFLERRPETDPHDALVRQAAKLIENRVE